MKLYNNTGNDVFYGISDSNSVDCGTINAGDTADLPGYDNQTNVRVTFAALPVNQVTPFSVTIPESGEGMAVTIGLFQE